jgi:hypothetical protein
MERKIKMKNKQLIKLYVPQLDESYDIFIPVNQIMWKINGMIVKCMYNIEKIPYDNSLSYYLMNKTTGKVYNNNELVINTDIINGTEMVLIAKSN